MKYDELVKSLRNCSAVPKQLCINCPSYDRVKAATCSCAIENMAKAADAIQELTAEQEQRWIKIKRKQLTPWSYVMDCKLPDNKQEVLVSDGQSIWIDTFNKDPEGLSFRYGGTEIEKLWWQPRPEPPEEDN